MRTTRAKFYVSGLTLLPGKDAGITVNLMAVARGDRNANWAKATPCGSMQMTVNNPAAADAWQQFMEAARRTGKSPEVFIDIAPSDDGWPGDGHVFRLSEVGEGEYGHGLCSECGLAQDADQWGWVADTQKSGVIGKAHPQG